MTIVAFLPPVSASEMHRRLRAEHFGGGFGAAGEDHGVDASVRDEPRPTVPPLQGANCKAVFGTPAAKSIGTAGRRSAPCRTPA